MAGPIVLRPLDVAVALALADQPGATYQVLARNLPISISTAHDAVARLAAAGLVRPEQRYVNRRALLEFLEHGVKYAFPGNLGPHARGVPTAYAGPDLAAEIMADEPAVWPDPDGQAFGPSVSPLLPRAARLRSTRPAVYAMLTLVDAIRVGRTRERALATAHLRARLTAGAGKAA